MRLNFHRRGSGEPLVLIHGIGSQWQIWTPVVDALAGERDVVAVDLPGFGESLTLRDEAPTVAALASSVAGFCRDELGMETADLGGNSLGGAIALELARTGFARSVCAFSPIGFYSERELEYLKLTLRVGRASARGLAPHADALMRVAPVRAGVIAMFMANPLALPPEAAAEAIRNLAYCPGWDATYQHAIGWRWPGSDAPVPVTVAWGTLDAVLLPTQARTAERELPAARHVALRRRGHVPMWEAADECVELLLEHADA